MISNKNYNNKRLNPKKFNWFLYLFAGTVLTISIYLYFGDTGFRDIKRTKDAQVIVQNEIKEEIKRNIEREKHIKEIREGNLKRLEKNAMEHKMTYKGETITKMTNK